MGYRKVVTYDRLDGIGGGKVALARVNSGMEKVETNELFDEFMNQY